MYFVCANILILGNWEKRSRPPSAIILFPIIHSRWNWMLTFPPPASSSWISFESFHFIQISMLNDIVSIQCQFVICRLDKCFYAELIFGGCLLFWPNAFDTTFRKEWIWMNVKVTLQHSQRRIWKHSSHKSNQSLQRWLEG